MNHPGDRAAIRLLDQSIIVRVSERAAGTLARLARTSMLAGPASLVGQRAAAHGSVVVLTAVVTHVLLTMAAGRPIAGYWLILPAGFGIIAAALLAVKARHP